MVSHINSTDFAMVLHLGTFNDQCDSTTSIPIQSGGPTYVNEQRKT